MQNARLYAAATWALEHTRLKHFSGASLAVLSPFQFNWPSRLSVTQIQITVIWLASVCPIGRRRVWVCKQRIQSGSIIQMPYHGTLTHKSSQKHHLSAFEPYMIGLTSATKSIRMRTTSRQSATVCHR